MPLQRGDFKHTSTCLAFCGLWGWGKGPQACAARALLPVQLYRCLFYFNTKTAGPVRELYGEWYWLCRPRNQHSMCRAHIKVA